MAEHNINFGHCIQFEGTSILAIKSGYMEHIKGEAREIELFL